MNDLETDIGAYTGGTAAITTILATAAFAAMGDAINRSIMIARTNAARRQIAERIRRDRADRRRLEIELSVAKCDAALARWHLAKLAKRTAGGIRR